MEEELSEQLEVDTDKIKNAVRLQLPLEITSYTLPRNIEIYIRKVLDIFLKECRQEHMYEYLNFCLSELLTNSKKANTKRVYFAEKNLDINNENDYEKGMETFKEDTLTNINHYLELQKKAGLYIKLSFQIKGEQIKMEIKNNAKITSFELARINKKIASVQQYKSMEDVFTNVLDQSEGAGLGIIIIILMLQKIGLSKENYQVIATEEETITRIILPCNQKVFAGNEILTYEFVKLQENIPVRQIQFEEVKKLMAESPINRRDFYELVRTDTSLAVLLLKYKIKDDPEEIDLEKVLKLYTDEELKEVFSLENKDINLVEESDISKYLYCHAKDVAFYAYNLTKNYPDLNPQLAIERIYTLGLINPIGAVLLDNVSKEQVDYINDLSNEYEDTEKILDLFYSGNSNAYISMIYAKKLGFSDLYAALMGNWNNAGYIPEGMESVAYILYLAEFLKFYEEKNIEYYQIDKKVLKLFGIETEEQVNCIINKLKTEN
ncbi:MAG: hypothetical protein K5866_04840 [Treponema sp.]|nr:hypothetical protein [Treponema sp.]